jgi:hypothetical protein
VAGSLAALTLASGIVTAVQHHRYEDNRTKPQDGDPATASRELEHQSSLVSKWALATDLFAAATLVSGGVAVYLRLRPKDVTEGAPPSSAALSSAEIMASFQF